MYVGLYVKCLLFLSESDDTCIFSTDFEKYSNIKFDVCVTVNH